MNAAADEPCPVRIAMWSGPRNVSTALMRSFGSRPDTVVVDEPFYAHYLQATGLEHPGRREILARHETDPAKVIASLLAPLPPGRRILYQKQMTHHLLPSVERGWLERVRHAFLIRDPAEVIASYSRVRSAPTLADLGMPQMSELFERERARTGRTPPVVDARDLLLDPPRVLRLLCQALLIEFDARMLAWEPGPRATDGVWAPHWYASVERSSGFAPFEPREVRVPGGLRDVHAACLEHYQALYAVRLGAA